MTSKYCVCERPAVVTGTGYNQCGFCGKALFTFNKFVRSNSKAKQKIMQEANEKSEKRYNKVLKPSLPSPIKNIDVDVGQVASTVNELISYLRKKGI